MLGTSILWTASVSGGPPGDTYDYQFSAALQGQNQIVRDFNTPNTFTWVPYTVEGTYAVRHSRCDHQFTPHICIPDSVWLWLSISSIANSLSCALAAHVWESPRWTPGVVKLLMLPR